MNHFGVAQTIEGNGEENRRMREVNDEMEGYFRKWIVDYDHVESLKEQCVNKHDKCVFWASIGECTKNPVSFACSLLLLSLFESRGVACAE